MTYRGGGRRGGRERGRSRHRNRDERWREQAIREETTESEEEGVAAKHARIAISE